MQQLTIQVNITYCNNKNFNTNNHMHNIFVDEEENLKKKKDFFEATKPRFNSTKKKEQIKLQAIVKLTTPL